jgi:hypothetical protein
VRGLGTNDWVRLAAVLILFLFLILPLEIFRMRNTIRMSGPRLRSGTADVGKNDGLGSARPLASAGKAAHLQSYNPTILLSFLLNPSAMLFICGVNRNTT